MQYCEFDGWLTDELIEEVQSEKMLLPIIVLCFVAPRCVVIVARQIVLSSFSLSSFHFHFLLQEYSYSSWLVEESTGKFDARPPTNKKGTQFSIFNKHNHNYYFI